MVTLHIFTPEGLQASLNGAELLVPSSEGEIGILKDHADYVGNLDIGIVSTKDVQDSKWIIVNGVCSISGNEVTLLTDEAHKADSQYCKGLLSKIDSFDSEIEKTENAIEVSRLKREKAIASALQ